MATTNKTSGTRSALTSAGSTKEDNTAKELHTLKGEVAELTKRLKAAEAKLAAPASVAAAPTGDFVTQREWKLLLQKLGSYIGFDLRKR